MKRSLLIYLWLLTSPLLLLATEYPDTIKVSKNEILILKDTIFAPDKDTIYVVLDENYKLRKNPYQSSEDFYRKLREKTGENKVTARLFELLYVNKDLKSESRPNRNSRTSNAPFIPYKGLTITDIRIKHVDILEGSVSDTSRQASSQIARLANRIHINTWNNVIRNNLLVTKGSVIDPYQLADNERILRRLRFIEDARIYVKPDDQNLEATLIVVVKDRLSWGTALEVDGLEAFNFEVFNRNIAGWGKYASSTWYYDGNSDPTNGYAIRTGGQNIDRMITNWEISHSNIADRESWGLSLQKEFVAPEIKYGGGLDIKAIRDSTIFLDGEKARTGFYDLDLQDFWIGRSFRLPSKNDRKNLILAGRVLNHRFDQQPFVSIDSNSLYYDRTILLGEISLSSQKFLKTNYIVRFGISEDIPIGYRFSFITGKDFNQFYDQSYFGLQLFWSFYLRDFGYFLLNQEVGAFQRTTLTEGVYRSKISYFSPLISSGRYHFRNFLTLSHTRGIDQNPSRRISLEERIRDIEGENITGNGTLVLAVESVLFTPWYFYGFRFAPFFYYNVGEIWDYRLDRDESHGYQGLGVGFRIRNESLVFNTLEFRMTHFLTTPIESTATHISLKASMPIAFDNIFRYKPLLVSFD